MKRLVWCAPVFILGLVAAFVTMQAGGITNHADTPVSATSKSVGPVTAPSSSQPVGDPLGKKWTRVFDDEFNGTAIDTNKWAALGGWHNNNISSDHADCAEGGGNLILKLPGNGTGCELASAPGYGAGANGYTLPVGGYVEARIWFPGPGSSPTSTLYNWPAFWTLGVNPGGSGESGGEIDIAEALRHLEVNAHSSTADDYVATPPGNWGNSWHVYGVYRGATEDQIFWDGHLVGTVATADNGSPETLLLSAGQTGGCCGGPVKYGSAGKVLVDWVRAWR